MFDEFSKVTERDTTKLQRILFENSMEIYWWFKYYCECTFYDCLMKQIHVVYHILDLSLDVLHTETIILDPNLPFKSDYNCRQYHSRHQMNENILMERSNLDKTALEWPGEDARLWEGELKCNVYLVTNCSLKRTPGSILSSQGVLSLEPTTRWFIL